MKREIFRKVVPLGDALALWRKALAESGIYSPLGSETIDVRESLGRVTAAPVTARISSPFYHASAMDGYAVRFTDTFGASEAAPLRLALGRQAVYVDTGDPLPHDFNAVVMVEDVNLEGEEIEIVAPVTPWENVRTVGEDIVATELIAPEGQKVRPVDMGAMLAGGLTEVSVRKRPKVAVIPTGTEIVEPGTELKRGDIIDFNSTVLGGLILEWGAEFIRMPIVPDDRQMISRAVSQAVNEADMVVTIAGASTGSEDYTEGVIKELGELVLHGVAIRPGKPAMLGVIDGTAVVGLPGYPVAAHTAFSLFARPVVMAMQGLEESSGGFGTVCAKLSRQVHSALGSEEFVRMKLGNVRGSLIATPLGRGAGLMMTLARADGVMRIPAMSEGLGAGAEVEVELLRAQQEVENTIVSIGSHDNAMDLLANSLKKRYPRFSLSSAHVGSMGGLMALKKNEAHIAPTHLLDEETGQYNTPFLRQLIPERKVVLVNLVYRTQGLMVLKGNPKNIKGLVDLKRENITFINRQRGAGTRLLLDKSLKELGISPEEITGYGREEFTHMAVASAVLTGVADTGLGVLSAANALGLDFVPVTKERYDLAIPADLMETEKVEALLDVIRNDKELKESVDSMGGYDVSEMGQLIE
ncbi:MAG: molybdopterin biosynthesis protein [Thermodesulfovibrionales bacterium]|nr:molybdopterin biosynthesis protein [Thermodesulfovibrionales bacterium]